MYMVVYHLGSMAAWEPQKVWLALGEQIRDIQALPRPFQTSSGQEGKTDTSLSRTSLRSLLLEPALGFLQIHNK